MRHLFKIIVLTFLSFSPIKAGAEDQTLPPPLPIVLELFTSQSCASCEETAAYFRELAARDDLIALGWHVDYWNLRSTKEGQWIDPYSSAAFTQRQRQYNINIRKRSSVFTPQIVIAGSDAVIGKDRNQVEAAIVAAKTNLTNIALNVSAKNGSVYVDIGSSEQGGNAYLVKFKRTVRTKIRNGANAGLDVAEVNVVTQMESLGLVRRTGAQFTVAATPADEGCAILIQEPGQKRILAAAYCPD